MNLKKYFFLFSFLLGLSFLSQINAYTLDELQTMFKDVDITNVKEVMNRMREVKFFETYPYANIEETAKQIQQLLLENAIPPQN
ncbi:MAG: hypothetical protein ABIA74_03100 [bacterium]